jgi:hypothetical protein
LCGSGALSFCVAAALFPFVWKMWFSYINKFYLFYRSLPVTKCCVRFLPSSCRSLFIGHVATQRYKYVTNQQGKIKHETYIRTLGERISQYTVTRIGAEKTRILVPITGSS